MGLIGFMGLIVDSVVCVKSPLFSVLREIPAGLVPDLPVADNWSKARPDIGSSVPGFGHMLRPFHCGSSCFAPYAAPMH